MKGQLREHPLVELIQEISRAAIPGVLSVARERVRAVVCFDAGEIVLVASNLRTQRLPYLLRQWGAVAPEQLVVAGVDALADEQAGANLIAAGALTAEELERFRQRQSVEALRSPLLWTDGQWTYDPRLQHALVTHAPIDAAQLLAEAARRLPEEFIAARLRDPEEVVRPTAGLSEGQQLSPEEAFILSRLDTSVRLSELVAVGGLPETQTLRAVYALFLCGLVGRAKAPSALRADVIAQARSAQAARPAPQVKTAAVAERTPKEEPAVEQEADPLAAVETLFERAAARTHYEVLGVGRSVPPSEIKRAYYDLARRFHPDRFRRDADEALIARIESAFTRVAQAYEILKESKTRAVYDTKLARAPERASGSAYRDGAGRSSDANPSGQAEQKPDAGTEAQSEAEELFSRGEAAHLRGDYEEAVRYLGQAATLAPQQARYRAQYGRALAQNRSTRRRAEAELQGAIALEPRNVEHRFLLAVFYRDIGLRRRAESELEQALRLDPNHSASRSLLQTLRQG